MGKTKNLHIEIQERSYLDCERSSNASPIHIPNQAIDNSYSLFMSDISDIRYQVEMAKARFRTMPADQQDNIQIALHESGISTDIDTIDEALSDMYDALTKAYSKYG